MGVASNIIFNEDYTLRGNTNGNLVIDEFLEILTVDELME